MWQHHCIVTEECMDKHHCMHTSYLSVILLANCLCGAAKFVLSGNHLI